MTSRPDLKAMLAQSLQKSPTASDMKAMLAQSLQKLQKSPKHKSPTASSPDLKAMIDQSLQKLQHKKKWDTGFRDPEIQYFLANIDFDTQFKKEDDDYNLDILRGTKNQWTTAQRQAIISRILERQKTAGGRRSRRRSMRRRRSRRR
jgi:hypothetical protein